MIIKEKIDITELFQELDMSKDKSLDLNEYLFFFKIIFIFIHED